jgi:hypothetical protein
MSDETATEVIDEPVEETSPGEFTVTLIDESKATIDGRIFEPGVVTWREPPMPLMFMTENGANGHKGSIAGGVITKVWRDGDKVLGQGHFDSGENGQELRRLIHEQILTGISSDVGGAIVEQEFAEDGTVQNRILQGRIMGATVLPFQAFDDTRIAVVASAVPVKPPAAWFKNPKLTGPTPLTITKDGQVFGHAALWDTCHIGRPGNCVSPPRSMSDYAYFMRDNAVETAEGDLVAAGPLTLGTGHAGMTLNGQAAAEHYDNTGTAVADVATGEDDYGIWMAGSVRAHLPDQRIAELRAAAVSGDWRGVQSGGRELVALLAVNTPGFPVPRARSTSVEDAPLALVAAGVMMLEEWVTPAAEELVADDACSCGGHGKTESLSIEETEAINAGGTIELAKKDDEESESAGDPGATYAESQEDEANEDDKGSKNAGAPCDLSDEEIEELEARVIELEAAVFALAGRQELNVGSGQKCSSCGSTVAAGRKTCHNCGASM